MGSTNKNSLIRILISPRLTYSRAKQWLTDEVCHVMHHRAWTRWTVPSVDRFLIKSMTGRSDMWTFVVIVDSSFVLECLLGKVKINMVNQEFQIEDRLSLPLWRRENPHNTAIFTQLSYLPIYKSYCYLTARKYECRSRSFKYMYKSRYKSWMAWFLMICIYVSV